MRKEIVNVQMKISPANRDVLQCVADHLGLSKAAVVVLLAHDYAEKHGLLPKSKPNQKAR